MIDSRTFLVQYLYAKNFWFVKINHIYIWQWCSDIAKSFTFLFSSVLMCSFILILKITACFYSYLPSYSYQALCKHFHAFMKLSCSFINFLCSFSCSNFYFIGHTICRIKTTEMALQKNSYNSCMVYSCWKKLKGQVKWQKSLSM